MFQLLTVLGQMPQPELIWKNAPPRWAVFLLVVAALAFTVVLYRRERGIGRPTRMLLGGLRLAALVALLAIYSNPVYETKASRFRKSAVVVLVDESLSMTLADRYTADELRKLWSVMGQIDAQGKLLRPLPERIGRIEIVNRLLDQASGKLLRALRKRNDVELYAFSSDLFPNIQPGKTRPQGRRTHLGKALQALLDQPRDRRIAAIVLLSDGQANDDQIPPLEAAKQIADVKIPIYAVGIGSPVKPKDIALLRLRAREKVLVGDKVTFQLELVQQGYDEQRSVPVMLEDISRWVKTRGTGFHRQMVAGQPLPLERDGRLLGREALPLGQSGALRSVRFVHAFATDGVYFLRTKVLPQPGEESIENNQLLFRIEVRDDRLRVLYVEGPPRWEYRYIKGWLVRDPKITANLYLASSDPDFPQEKSPEAPELVNWPPARDELFKYHVVILGDVDPATMGGDPGEARRFLKDLRDFVDKRGGGLILIAGEGDNNPQAFEHNPQLRALMPVQSLEADRGRNFPDPKRLVRSLFGAGHPIFQLEDDPRENKQVWDDHHVGIFYWFRKTRPVPGAHVLATHPDETYQYKAATGRTPEQRRPYPIFVLRNFGRGKVFFSATDDLWRWRFLRGDQYHHRFWAQVIRYVGSPSLFGDSFHYKLTTDKQEYEPGQRVQVTLEVLDREFNPAQDKSWQVRSRNPAGVEENHFLARSKQRPGLFSGGFYANFLGRWELWVDRNEQRGILEQARLNFDVRIPNVESRNPELNRPLLQKLAEMTDGAYFEAWDAAKLPPLIKKEDRRRASTLGRSRSAWDLKWVLAVLLGLLFCEWFLRKLFRLH